MEGTALLKIGDFSKLSRISVRMLRHYDEIGLLRPVFVDQFTDYRYYAENQLPIVGRITALKDMGFRLAEISSLLALYAGCASGRAAEDPGDAGGGHGAAAAADRDGKETT